MNEQLTGITESFAFVIPELVLTAGLIVVLVAGLFNNNKNKLFNAIAFLTAAGSFILLVAGGLQTNIMLFNGVLQRDGFGEFLMLLVDLSVGLTCLMSIRNPEGRHLSEYYVLILSVALGCHLLLMSTNFIIAFLSLELISISSYVLAGYSFNKSGSEGSLKYFLFGSTASAIMLYGFTILYGLTGTIDFTSSLFFDRLIDDPSPLLLIGGLMGLAGFLFKMGAAPMHPWAPDVYEAAPVPVIAFLSVAPKLAAIGVLTKLLLALHLFGQGEYDWQMIIAAVAILTITIGNFSALWQKNPKRMMAYSSIAQSGFLLVGVAAFLPQGIHFMLFYAAIYLLMNFAVFVYLSYFEMHGVYSMPSFAGRGKRFIWASVGLTVGLVALTGLPPTSGFTAKLFIFSSLWESYQETHKSLLLWLLIFGLLNTVVSLFYYLRIPYFAFIKAGESPEVEKKGGFENFLGLILVVLIVVIFFIPGLLMSLINRINFVL
ncbi:MAG: NADH-quinone oxidoreductase subunit N [Cyclobacteriaceae bacterium]